MHSIFYSCVNSEKKMSYLMKLQPTHALFDSVLNNSKHGGTMYHSFPSNFYRPHLILQNNVQEISTNASALKILPLKKEVSKRKKKKILKEEKALVLQNTSSKMNIPKTTRKQETVLSKKRPLLTDYYNRNHHFGSTMSYDLNLLDHNLEIEKFFKECSSSENVKNILSPGSSILKDSKEIYQDELKRHVQKVMEIKQQNKLNEKKFKELKTNLSVSKADLQRSLKINKTNNFKTAEESSQAYKPSLEKDIPDTLKEEDISLNHKYFVLNQMQNKNALDDVNFENFSEYISNHNNALQVLSSSLDICVSNKRVLEGYMLMKNFRRKNVWNDITKEEHKNIRETYNLLLHSLSEEANWDLMQDVVKWMALDNIKMDCESFAALFYCLTKQKDFENEKLLEDEVNSIIAQLFINNVSLHDIFSKALLPKEKAEKILALIQKVIPSFDFHPVTINLSSDCPLVKNLFSTENKLESPVDNVHIDTLKDLVEEQLFLENKFMIKVKAVSRGFRGESSEECKKKFSDLKKDWKKCLEKAFINKINNNNLLELQKSNLNIYLNSLPSEMFADIMIETAVNLIECSVGTSTVQCSLFIGNKVAYKYQIEKKLRMKNVEKSKSLFHNYLSWYLDPKEPARNSRQMWQMLIQTSDEMCAWDSKIIKWPYHIKQALGKIILNLIIKELKFPIERAGEKKYYPVLYTILRCRDGTWREEIKCHPNILKLFQKLGFEDLYFRADHMPMVCPPKPWKCSNHGGYLILPTDLIRKSFSISGKVLKLEDLPLKNLYPTIDALNALQAVPWMVNEEVLDVALEVFRNGGSEKLSVPSFPETVQLDNKNTKSYTFKEQMERNFLKKKLEKKRIEDYGLWIETLYRLSLANHFRKKLFWLPQNCDFRGRVYPVPALLNHVGADLYRSLLIFGKGKPLGPNGLDWLKIHLINLTGTHKRKTVLERLSYANEILPSIMDSAEKPLTGHKWWMESDEPWQTLAACMEIKKALSVSNPENYVCRFPIHQDGSCNGLQHYAGLGKDLIGAQSVNLASLKTPQDVYSVVAKLIEEERAKDAEKGSEVAKRLNGIIERKVIKQTVMTTVYGVTHYGAKLQISKRLEEIPNFPEEYIKPAAAYLTNKTFLCLTKMFTSAKEIQNWLVGCALAISSANDYVQWTSPLGLPVLQSYGKVRMNSASRRKIILPDKLKQKNAFPPNFIHCLDSSHMMLTTLFCEQAGVTFAAVHDCYWTHPSHVDLMNKICREQFISLHSQPILENLSEFFIKQYLENGTLKDENMAKAFIAIPEKGTFDLNDVLNSEYFFS